MSNTFTCPNCGADVPRNASACPECGSDESTGWAENAGSYGVLPAEYEPMRVSEDGRLERSSGGPARGWTRYTAAILLAAMAVPVFLFLGNFGHTAAVGLLAAALVLAWTMRPRKATGTGSPGNRDRSSDDATLYETLVRRARGDRARANRLIEYERGRNPSASRAELIRDAIERLERDLR